MALRDSFFSLLPLSQGRASLLYSNMLLPAGWAQSCPFPLAPVNGSSGTCSPEALTSLDEGLSREPQPNPNPDPGSRLHHHAGLQWPLRARSKHVLLLSPCFAAHTEPISQGRHGLKMVARGITRIPTDGARHGPQSPTASCEPEIGAAISGLPLTLITLRSSFAFIQGQPCRHPLHASSQHSSWGGALWE